MGLAADVEAEPLPAGRLNLALTDPDPDDGITELDTTEPDAAVAAVAGVEAVVHLAANPNPAADWTCCRGPTSSGR